MGFFYRGSTKVLYKALIPMWPKKSSRWSLYNELEEVICTHHEETKKDTKREETYNQNGSILGSFLEISTPACVQLASFGVSSKCWPWKSVQFELVQPALWLLEQVRRSDRDGCMH